VDAKLLAVRSMDLLQMETIGAACLQDADCFGAPPYSNGACDVDRTQPTCECYALAYGANCDALRKSQQTALVLSVLLGPYGAERFYLGLIGTMSDRCEVFG
jgi:hypothetical protein